MHMSPSLVLCRLDGRLDTELDVWLDGHFVDGGRIRNGGQGGFTKSVGTSTYPPSSKISKDFLTKDVAKHRLWRMEIENVDKRIKRKKE